MAVSTTKGTVKTVAEIVKAGMQQAGLVYAGHDPDPDDSNLARTLLDVIIDALQAKGVTARRRTFRSVTLTASTQTYDLDDDVLDTVGNGAYKESAVATTELLIFPLGADGWQRLPVKTVTGRPTMYWLDRSTAPLQVYLWPVPCTTGAVAKFQVHTTASDSDKGADTIDLDTYQYEWAVMTLAYKMAVAKLMEPRHIANLKSDSQRSEETMLRFAKQHTGTTMQVSHKTAWRYGK